MKHLSAPSQRESLICLTALTLWLLVTVIGVGFRPEHPIMALALAGMFFAAPASRRLLVALLPFILFGISYDWMNLLPNYKVNPIDIQGLYEAERTIFGIAGLTPNEWMAAHTHPILDFLGGVFYLCWVPVPIIFGLWLYFTGQKRLYLKFAIVFLLVNLLGFAIYYIHPAAPPWFVAQYGFEPRFGIPGSVAGLGAFDEMTGLGIFNGLYARNANVYAAVPSLHSAYTLVAFIYSLRAHRATAWKILLGIITLGIWFTAVYTSHHYLIDVLLGISTALAGAFLFEFALHRSSHVQHFLLKYTTYITK